MLAGFARAAFLVAAVSFAGALPAGAAVVVGGVYPFAVGDTFVFQFNQTTTVGTTKTPISYVETTTIEPETTYAGVKAYPFHTTGRYTTAQGTSAVSDLEYRNFVTVGSQLRYASYGYADSIATAESGNVVYHQIVQRQYGTPFLYDILPEKTGSAWAQPVAILEKTDEYDVDPGGDTSLLTADYTRAADGSYTDKGVSSGVPFTRVLHANGTGYDSATLSKGVRTWTYGLPFRSGAAYVVPAVETYAGSTTDHDVPDWYPGHGAPSQPLATSGMYDLGKQTAPSQCGKRAGTAATRIEYLFKQLDPVDGFTYSESQNYYIVPGVGRICRLESIVETVYNQQSTGSVASVTTTVSAQVLLSETLH